MCTTFLGGVLALIEHLLVLYNLLVAPVKNPSVAIGTTKPGLEPSFLFQSTIVSSFFSIAFLPSIKIFFKGICDGQSCGMASGVFGLASTDLGMPLGELGMASTDLGMASGVLGMAPTDLGMASGKLGMASTDLGMASVE